MPTPDASWPAQAIAGFAQRAELIAAGEVLLFALVATAFVLAALLSALLVAAGLRR